MTNLNAGPAEAKSVADVPSASQLAVPAVVFLVCLGGFLVGPYVAATLHGTIPRVLANFLFFFPQFIACR